VKAGTVLDDRYQVEEPLSRGGMGTIWTATDLETGQLVAVKVLRFDAHMLDGLTPAERTRRRIELVKRFNREGAVLEDLQHPGIPRLLHRGGHLAGLPYLVMEYVEGVSLRTFLDVRRPFPFDAAVAVAVQVAEALEHAHANGVVHRDLKPDNVVVASADGVVKLLDFGIAHLTDPDATRYTALGDTPGSTGYMAPEQLRGQKDISASADLYAFGCVLFELLTGERPFEDKPDRNKSIQHLEDLPPRLRSINVGIPEEVDDLVWDLLAKAPADRPQAMDEVLLVLKPFLPKPGDPAPDPELDPDPTARYRLQQRTAVRPSDVQLSSGTTVRRTVRRRGGWLGRKQFVGRIVQARAELKAEGPGDLCAELLDLLPRAVSDWGNREPIVLEGRLVCADAARLDGRTGEAKEQYEHVAEYGDPRDPLVLEARLGVAECLIPEGNFAGAFSGWCAVLYDLPLLVEQVSDRLADRCREVGVELAESGYEAEVADLLALLPKR
jgi:serine/threonine protein kinase